MLVSELFEAAVGAAPSFKPIDLAEAKIIFNTKCSDAHWMLEHGPIWRGDDETSKHDYAVVDPSKTKRKSQNTSNYYTEIFDNIPSMSNYPKRSASMIASMSNDIAYEYGDPHAIIPFNGTKIGIVGPHDIYELYVTLFDEQDELARWNALYKSRLKIADTWDAFNEFQKKLNDGNIAAIKKFYSLFPELDQAENRHLKFLDEIKLGYSPAETGMKLATTKNMRSLFEIGQSTRSEVWIGGPCLIMNAKTWKAFVKEQNG